MGIVARQSIANALYTYIGIGLGAILTLFLYPNILDPDQYGLTRVLISAAMIGAQFAHLGMRQVIIRFFPLFRAADKRENSLLFLALVIPLFGYLLFSLLFLLFRESLIEIYSDRSPLFVDFVYYILPLTLFILYFEVLNSYLRSLRDAVSGSLISEVIHRGVIISILALFFFSLISFRTFIFLFSTAYALQPFLLIVRLIRMGEFHLSFSPRMMRRSLAKGMATYGMFTLLGGLTTVIVWNVDVIMLGSIQGLEDTAIYAIAFYIGSVIAVPQRSIDKIASPLIADYIRQKKTDRVKELYQKTSLNQSIAGIFILLLIWANSAQLLELLPDVYQEGRIVILFIGLGKLFDMATGISGGIIINSRHYRFDLVANLLLIFFTVTTNLLLIPLYGITGAALATLLSLFLYNLIKFLFVWIRFSMQPFSRKFLLLIFLALLSFGLLSLLPDLPLLIHLAATTVILILSFLLPVWYVKLSEDLNRLIERFLPDM